MSDRFVPLSEKSSLLFGPRLELAFMLIAWGLGAVFALVGLAIVGPEVLAPLVFTFTSGFLFNLLLVWLDRRGGSGQLVTWGARLGNLAFLTASVYLTGGFRSPFFALYCIYLVVAALRYGWRGALHSFVLFALAWAFLAILQPPASLGEWAWVGMLVGAFAVITLAVGALADRQVRFWQESQRRNREMAFLREAGRSLAASLDPQEVLAATLAQVNELLEVEAASLALVDEVTGRITFELAIGGANEKIVGLRLEPGEGIVGQVIEEGRSILVPEVAADPRWHSDVDSMSGYQTRSILCVPLRVKGQIIGALEALNKRDGPFTEYDQRLLSSLADLAAQSIENARLHDQLQRNARRLRDAYTEVQQADELKSAFIRNVTHELRTPLALIEGYVELFLDGQMGPLETQQQQSLALVSEKSAQLTHLVNDIISLQTVRAIGYEFEVLSLASLIRASMDEARPKAERARIRLELNITSAEELPLVRGDPLRLRRAFDHLLDNAVKFSPNGGVVRLSIKREQDMLFVRVADEGIGLPTDKLEQIFERFYQIDGSSTRRYGGTGLGLAQVKEVVEAHGGSVWAESAGPDQGSTFVLFLPIHEPCFEAQSQT